MRKFNIVLFLFCIMVGMGISCQDFLDTLPDNRTEINDLEKVASVLVNAYPTTSAAMVNELSSDNMMDNGPQYAPFGLFEKAPYLWQDINTRGNDDPFLIWQSHYGAIAAANLALKTIEELGTPEESLPYKAEALLCRAYNHFVLVNVFSMHYNPETASKDLGIPYVKELETVPFVKYSRGTVAEVYEKINADIEAALPYVVENANGAVKYHFNPEAAHAFAARFNLFYQKFDKTITHASKVLGSNPESKQRNYERYTKDMNWVQIPKEYVQSSEEANFLLIPYTSNWPYVHWYGSRYGHSAVLNGAETYLALGPWGTSGAQGKIYYSKKILRATEQAVFYPKIEPFFEYTDKTAGIGYLHMVIPVFSGEETLLCRAEAYALTGKYDEATTDLALWMKTHCVASAPVLTREKINTFYEGLPYAVVPTKNMKEKGIKKHLNPQGFTVTAGEQENFIHCVLHFRRLETMFEGMRWYDIKRYGIEIDHLMGDFSPIVLAKEDPRRAIQLPQDVISKGLTENPR